MEWEVGSRCDEIIKTLKLDMDKVPRPRAPPRFLQPPAPCFMEKPGPIVPDVSLIFDSTSTSMHSVEENEFSRRDIQVNPPSQTINFSKASPYNGVNINTSRSQSQSDRCSPLQILSSASSNDENDVHVPATLVDTSESVFEIPDISNNDDVVYLKSSLASVISAVQQQELSIARLSSQVQQLMAFQETLMNRVPRRNSSVSIAVQTGATLYANKSCSSCENCTLLKESRQEIPISISQQSEQLNRQQSSVGSDAAIQQNSSNPLSVKNHTYKSHRGEKRVTESLEDGNKNMADLSTFLQNLQLGNVQAPSMYSNASVQAIEIPDFHNGTFQNDGSDDPHRETAPIISTYDSNSDDEYESPVTPSATYYNNLLGTVNRILKGSKNSVNSTSEKCLPTTNDHVLKAESTTMSYSPACSSYPPVERNVNGNNDTKSTKHNPICHSDSALPAGLGNRGLQKNGTTTDATKQYLQTLGIQFDCPISPSVGLLNGQEPHSQPIYPPSHQQQQNYMIQQNVFNSIYIPTVNCVPVIADSLNSNSGLMDNLAHKYVGQADRYEYEKLNENKPGRAGATETTIYGMSANNLSFSTKEYLQRYGLINQPAPLRAADSVLKAEAFIPDLSSSRPERILDITAIKNQPKLL